MMASAFLDRGLIGSGQHNLSLWMTERFQCYEVYESLFTTSRLAGLLLINSLHKLADDEWHALYSLNLLLCSHKLAFETPVL